MRGTFNLTDEVFLSVPQVAPLVQALVSSNAVSKLLFTFFPPLTLNSGPWLRGAQRAVLIITSRRTRGRDGRTPRRNFTFPFSCVVFIMKELLIRSMRPIGSNS